MPSDNTLTICLLTAHRLDYAVTTLESVLNNVRYSGPLHVHIASDGDDDDYMHRLADIVVGHPISTSNTGGGRGYGANWNAATQVIHGFSNYVLPLEDDWELTRELNLDVLTDALSVFGCVRLGYIGYTQPLRCTFIPHMGYHYLALDPESPEPHVFAGHPRLESVWWERNVGPWPEGLTPGETEFAVAHRLAARQNVVWPISLIPPEGGTFQHIGTVRSY